MPKALYKDHIGRAFVCKTWLDNEFAVITSVYRKRVNYTRLSVINPDLQIPMNTTTTALKNLEDAGVVRFSPKTEGLTR